MFDYITVRDLISFQMKACGYGDEDIAGENAIPAIVLFP